jgi:hypothetical protein
MIYLMKNEGERRIRSERGKKFIASEHSFEALNRKLLESFQIVMPDIAARGNK